MQRFIATLLAFVIFVTMNVIISYPFGREGEEISYDEAIQYISDTSASSVNVYPIHDFANLEIKDDSTSDAKKVWVSLPDTDSFISFVTDKVQNGEKFNIKVNEKSNIVSITYTILNYVYAFVLVFIILLFLTIPFRMRRIQYEDKDDDKSDGLADFKKLISGEDSEVGYTPIKTNVKLTDVAGMQEVKSQVQDIIDYFKNPKKFHDMGAKLPKGMLLYGPPGTGKTLLAKAIAGEANISFFQVAASSFEEKYVGVGASRVRELFDAAKKAAPAIIAIEEIDAVGSSRNDSRTQAQTLNQLLVEMDGFTSSDNIFILATTNRYEDLDEALIRPGRIDRHIEVFAPNPSEREQILLTHARGKSFGEDVSMSAIAKRTPGFTGADLANVLNEAAIIAVQENSDVITNDAIDEAISRVMVGLKREDKSITPEDIHEIAVHESGHAVISKILRPNVKNCFITIASRGSAGGYNMFNSTDNYCSKQDDLLNEIKVCYGGRAAEELLLGYLSSGASSDLKHATQIALKMYKSFAMGDSLLVEVGNSKDFNNILLNEAHQKANELTSKAYEDVKNLISANKAIVLKLAAILEEKESLSETEIEQFFAENPV